MFATSPTADALIAVHLESVARLFLVNFVDLTAALTLVTLLELCRSKS